LALAILFIGALFINVHRPFLRHREAVCSAYAVLARNHVRLGYAETRLGLYEISASDPSVYGEWRRYGYPNRPALSVFVTSLWFHLLGDREWVLRLSLIAVALGTVASFAALARRILAPPWVWVAIAAFAFNPMFWYFSIVAVHLAYALLFSMAAWASWVRWEEGRRARILTFVFLFLACQSDWPGYFAVASIAGDAFLSHRRRLAVAILGFALGCFGLHLAHLFWLDPTGGFLRRFLSAGAERSVQGLPNPLSYLVSEGREAALYFTVGGLLLVLAALKRLPRRAWLLALLGLEEVIFMRWAHVHDYLSFSLVPFFAVAVVRGTEALWTTPARRLLAGLLLALGAAQSLWITGDRLTREGAYEVTWRAGVAIRDSARPGDRVLITIADERLHTPYYADRYTAGVEPDDNRLVVHHSDGGIPVSGSEDLVRFFGMFDLVLVGDPERASREIAFFRGQAPPAAFGFLDPSHPLRRALEQRALSKETRGAFVLYRLR
jgi:hypothetical protein